MEYVEAVHAEQPGTFSNGTLLCMFSLWCLPRRGVMLVTTGKVAKTIVELMNWRRTKEGASIAKPNTCYIVSTYYSRKS